MGHSLTQLGTASLDTMGGLITFASPRDVPEGGSPRNWDVDYAVGKVFTRPGLRSVYSYSTVLLITGYSLGSGGLASFTYVGPEPTPNEGFFLSGFTGNLSVLNGQEVFAESVDATHFVAIVVNGPFLTVNDLTASAISSTGLFVGPNIGSMFNGPAWNFPSNISSATGYASTNSNLSALAPGTPTAAVNQTSAGIPWTNPTNIFSASAYATVGLSPSSDASKQLFVNGTVISIPSSATVTGIGVSLKGFYAGTGTQSVSLQMTTAGTPVGTPVVFALASSPVVYTKGSSQYTWGTTFTPATVNGAALGILVRAAEISPGAGSGTFSLNSLMIIVYYTTAAVSSPLFDQGFSFSVPLNSGITGFGASFSAYTDNATSVTLQMLQGGIPVGTPKTIQLTTTPTLYTLGNGRDMWGNLWSAANVNAVTFGVQVSSSGVGNTFIGDLDIVTYITPALSNFNWIGSYEQDNMALSTLALDASGTVWHEDVINNPGVLSVSLAGLLPGSFANGATFNNSEFLMFSDLAMGTDRPRQLYSDGNWYPVTQVGPGVPPSFQAATGSIGGVLQLTAYSQSGSVGTFSFNAVTAAPTVDSLYVINGTGTALDGQVVIVLSGSTVTSFTAEVIGTIPNGSYTGIATPQFFYAISSITQQPTDGSGNPYIHQAPQLGFLLGASPGAGGTGTCVTVWYNVYGYPAWPALVAAMANAGVATYIEITGASTGSYNFNGIWQVNSLGTGYYPGTTNTGCYFTFTFTQSGSFGYHNFSGASAFLTAATMTLSTPIASLAAGTQVTITGVTPQTGWNNTWTISQAVHDGLFDIDATSYDYSTNIATYQYHQAGLSNTPATAGSIINIINCTNNAGFNGTFVIAGTPAPTGSTFSVLMTPPLPAGIAPGFTVDNQGIATQFGTVFTFDPGENFVGTPNTNVNYGTAHNGQITVIGSLFTPIGAGTRQGVVFFITAAGAWTPASPPVTFTVPSDANILNVSNIPIGPPDVVGRGIAITDAGANGVPGANFYVITLPVVDPVNGRTYTSTIINDNTSPSAAFSFTDAVLLNSQEVDVPGFNLFNLIELGSCGWCVPYSSRMFYGMQLNKVQNFNNLTFDGGYIAPNQPAGWGLYLTANEISLIASPVTGDALYIINTTGSIQARMGMMVQTAYQDPYKVAIISPNTGYSVRVAASCPSGIRLGNLVIDLTDLSAGVFGTTYGSFTVPLSSMGVLPTVFSGVLLVKGIFPGSISTNLQLRVWVQNMGIGADTLIERIEVYPTTFPYLKTEVYGSYINKPEWVDASGDGGIIDTSTENAQTCFGGFVMRSQLYLAKSSSLYSVKDNPNSEPGGWSLDEISNRVGACGINAYDVGEEWAVMACRNGIYGFDGGKPQPMNLEIMQIWDCINFDAGNSICLRNDTQNRRILCAIPLPTGTSPEGVPTKTVAWLPYAKYNPAPTTPNVMLMLNYQDIGDFAELMGAIGTHATMFGTLANPDMRRKWSIWQIPSPYMGAVTRGNYLDAPLYVCNGIESSKIYIFDIDQRSDDEVPIYGLYTTYGHVNAVKAATLPIFGMHTKRYTILQANIAGSGTCSVRMLPNDLSARFPYSIPGGIPLHYPANDDYFRPINCKAQRLFLEFSTNAVGSWFELDKTLLTGKQDPWSSLNPTGGGNMGIA